MFKIFTRVAKLEARAERDSALMELLVSENTEIKTRLTALEEYLNIEFFNGPMQKPHYRKTRVITKKLGRPKKVTK